LLITKQATAVACSKIRQDRKKVSIIWLGFLQTEDALALLELTTLFQNFDALETLEHIALRRDCSLTS